MNAHLKPVAPASESEAAEIVRAARAAKTTLRILGGGTRAGLGRPVRADAILSTAGLAGITLYEPAEMVIGARAGTPLATVERTLAGHGQMLPFEPMDHRALYGTSGEPTIGAVAAGNISGPRRISPAGAARDSLIGVRFINGQGEAVKSGGRVMKNVTGLDLVKLQSGALGTLGLLTEVIFKVLPRPEAERTLMLEGLDDARAVAALAAGLTSPYEISAAAHVPDVNGKARTLLRIEGFAEQLAYRTGTLSTLLKPFGSVAVLGAKDSAMLWREVRDVTPLAEPRDTAIWRLSVKPSDGPAVVAAIGGALPLAGRVYDWGGGLVWLAVAATGDAGAGAIRAAVAARGGHATLVRAPEEVRARLAVFQPEVPAVARLTAGIRAGVDPDGILNPGLMGT